MISIIMYSKRNEFDTTSETLTQLQENLNKFRSEVIKKTCFLGFDGYIDSLYSIVETRVNSENWKRMESLRTFGELIKSVAGSSGNIERVLKKKIFGGFAPNTARALSTLGVSVHLIASLGHPKLSDLYKPDPNIATTSIGNPGETSGLEFDDGKVMITDFEPILKISWDSLVSRTSIDLLIHSIGSSNVMGFGHWALIPSLNDIWSNMVKEVFPSINKIDKKLFFVDIADIRKRSKKDILTMLSLLHDINDQVPVMLSANDQEAILLSEALDKVRTINPQKNNFEDFHRGGKLLNEEAGLSYLVIHSPHFATISTQDAHHWITEGFTSKPKITTAAGDHFHSGVAIGLACDLSPPESILLGNALTAIFVRTGKSPNIDQISLFLETLKNG